MSAARGLSMLSRHDAARVWQAAQRHSARVGLVVGIALVTGWRVPEVARRLRRLSQGVTR